MDLNVIETSYKELQVQYNGFEEFAILSKDGEILIHVPSSFLTSGEAKNLLDVWLNTKPAIEIGGIRYPVLKWDAIQLAARNTGGKGAIIGSIMKSGDYSVVHLTQNCSTPLLAATVALNRWAWNLI